MIMTRALIVGISVLAFWSMAPALVAGQERNGGEKAGSREEPPRGLFRRLRDDIREAVEKDRDSAEKKQREKTAAEAEKRERELAARRSGNAPTPAQRPGGALLPNEGRFPESMQRAPGFAPGANDPALGLNRATDMNQPPAGFRLSDNPGAPEGPSGLQPPVSAGPGKPPRTGFGLTLIEEGEELLIKSVAVGGNAEAAGLRKGDQLAEIGGVGIQSIKEFDEITGVMGPGDQIEVAIARNGKSEKVLLQFGSAEEAPADATGSPVDASSQDNSMAGPDVLEGPSLLPPGEADFVPREAAAVGTDSVLSRGRGANGPVTPPTLNRGNSSVIQPVPGFVPDPAQAGANSPMDAAAWQRMQQTIQQQQQTIQRLEQQLNELQRQSGARRRN